MVLQTLHGEVIGVIGSYFELDMQIKFADVSEISFKVPAYDNGVPTPLYDDIQSYRMVQIDPYGIYVLQEPNVSGDGIQEVKEVSASSIEILLSNKRIVLEEGTYQLSAIMDVVHEAAPDWTVEINGSVGSNFRTFDETDESLLDWLRNTAAKSYGCLFDCDPYTMTIHVIDAYEDYDIVPIYLTYDNLLKQQDVSVSIKDFFTVLRVSGADPVDIHEVNPIGTNRIYNLDYFIENGDIEEPLASKWRAWQDEVYLKQDFFISLSTLYNSAIMRKLQQEAKLKDLKGELDSLESIASVTHNTIVNATTDSIRQSQEELYAQQMNDIASKKDEIASAESELDDIQSDIETHNASRLAVTDQLRPESYFTESELGILSHYFIESDFTDDTFATFDVDISGENDEFTSAASATISVTPAKEDDVIDVDVASIDPDGIINKRIILLNGGTVTASVGGMRIEAEILSGTFEQDNETNHVVCSIYTGYGSIEQNGVTNPFGNGNITITADGCTYASGDNPLSSAGLTDVDLYFTKNTTQFESYAVQKELYEHAMREHEKIAYPGCEFDIKSGNILFAKEFEQFRDVLAPGKGLFLELSDRTVLTPLLLEVHFSFEDPTNFDLIFSNTFQRHDNVTNMKKLLEQARSTARTLDMAKYNYGAFKRNGAENEVRTLFTQGLDVGSKQILAGRNNSVVIDGAGITISNPDDATVMLRMNNGMFTFMDESDHAQLAIGKFYDTGLGKTTYGVVAPNVVGTLLAGENLVINSPKFDGTNMFFTVDANGARLANGQFDIYKHTESGGQDVWGKTISLDPNLGILAGNLDNAIVYDSNGTILGVNAGDNITVNTLSALQSKGGLVPNFWVDLNGDVFMKGTIYATDGVFTGTIHATNGDFTGTLSAPTLSGKMSVDGTSGGTIRGASISVGGTEANPNFLVDSSGNVTMKGNIVLNGNITWGAGSEPTATADSIANGTYSGGSFIDGTTIRAPHIYGDAILGVGANGGTYEDESKNYNFYVDSDGNVVMNGGITLNGNITWSAGSSSTQTVYAQTALTKPANNSAYSSFPDSSTTAWHKTVAADDYYVSYTYDGGATWTDAILFRGTVGQQGPQGPVGPQGPQGPKGDSTEATVTRASILQALTAGSNGIDGIYKATVNGQECIRINATYIDAGVIDTARLSSDVITTNNLSAQNITATQITAGTLNANNITTTGHFTFKYNPDFMGEITYGTMGQYAGSTTGDNNTTITTYGTAMYGKDGNFLITCTDYGARMSNDTSDTRIYVDENHAVLSSLKGPHASVSVNNAGGVVVSGTTFTWNSAAVSTSDIRRKHDISYDVDKYVPFMLALKTARFKYNDGTSNRYHSGFIAQDVKNALDDAGLTTQEFAGYVSVNEIDDKGEVSETYLGLRYEEFISLNTYMIQRLYARVVELENQISLLSGGNE